MFGLRHVLAPFASAIVICLLAPPAEAELRNPYVVEDNSPQWFGDTAYTLGDLGLYNYSAGYVNGYLNIKYDVTHRTPFRAGYPPEILVTKADPRLGFSFGGDVLRRGLFFPNINSDSTAATGTYNVNIQFSGEGFTPTTRYSDGQIWGDGLTPVPGLTSSSWAALHNSYPVSGCGNAPGDCEFSMAFTPMPVVRPQPAVDPITNPGLRSRVTTVMVENGTQIIGAFNHDAPTYVVTHGWQPEGNYVSPEWNFDGQPMPEMQQAIGHAITARLNAEEVGPANIVYFEWEGAYTAGEFLEADGAWIWEGSRGARPNADTAAVLLGHALADKFGDDYSQDVHFIGHSFGTIVNGLATRYLGDKLGEGDIQFTILDAPTDAPPGLAPHFDDDWFEVNLDSRVDYLDNYFGYTGLLNFGPDLYAYGERTDGAAVNQPVQGDHAYVGSGFYPELIRTGQVPALLPQLDQVDDWITPLLSTYSERPDGEFIRDEGTSFFVGQEFAAAVGAPVFHVPYLPGYEEYLFQGTLLAEQSPVSAFQILEIPTGAKWLLFDWMVGAGGDGDWITVYFGDDLLWSMSIDELFTGVLLNAAIDISGYAGRTDTLYFSLNNVGDKNAQFYFGNLELRGSTSPVPAPPAGGLLGVAIAGFALAARRKKAVSLN